MTPEDAGQVFLVRDAVLLLGFALAFVLLFRRIGLGATLGYLLAGAVVGPSVLGIVGGAEEKNRVAELGITLLLFVVGLELNPSRLWKMKRDILGLGLIQVAACGVLLTALIWFAARLPLAAALALGLPLALSSTAQVLPLLQSSGRLRTPFGERAFAILLFQDVSIVVLITIVAALGHHAPEAGGPPGWKLALYSVAAIGGLIAVGRFALRPLFRLIGNLGEREMFVVAALFTVLAAAALMQYLGLSTALGAFIAGVMLADTPYRHELEADVEPFRSILLGLFFLSVGMLLNLGAIAERPFFVVGMALALIVVKTVAITTMGLMFRMTWRSALGLGLLLSQGGEFGFVLFAQAQAGALIAPETASLFAAIVTLSMVTTPFLMGATKTLREAPVERDEERAGPEDDGANALIVGYGRFGQTVAQMLIANDVPVTMIDTDVEMIDVAGDFGAKVYFGDGTRIDVLRQAGAEEAELILFCIDGDQITADMLHAVHEAFPRAAIYLRAFDRRAVVKLEHAPVCYIVREVLESAIKMARMALESLDVPPEAIDRAEDLYRTRDRERLRKQIETGDLRSARDRILTQPPNAGR